MGSVPGKRARRRLSRRVLAGTGRAVGLFREQRQNGWILTAIVLRLVATCDTDLRDMALASSTGVFTDRCNLPNTGYLLRAQGLSQRLMPKIGENCLRRGR